MTPPRGWPGDHRAAQSRATGSSKKKVMTWSRGFFRIWVAVSAIWIGLSIYFAGSKTYLRLWQGAEYELEFPSGHRTTFDTSKSRGELLAEITEEWKREAMRNGPAADEILRSILARRDDLPEAFASNNEKLHKEAEYVWLATFIPPLVLLGLGLCIAWIVRGFRAART